MPRLSKRSLGRTRLREIAFGAGVNVFYGGARNPGILCGSLRIQQWIRGCGGGAHLPSGSAQIQAVPSVYPRPSAAWSHKPTYSLVPSEGVMPLSPTLDHGGILALTMEMCGCSSRPRLVAVNPAAYITLPRRISLVRESLAGADAIVHTD